MSETKRNIEARTIPTLQSVMDSNPDWITL